MVRRKRWLLLQVFVQRLYILNRSSDSKVILWIPSSKLILKYVTCCRLQQQHQPSVIGGQFASFTNFMTAVYFNLLVGSRLYEPYR